MQTLTDRELLDLLVAVGPQAVLEVFESADHLRMPGEKLHPSYVGRVFSLRAGELARRHLPYVDVDAYEKLAQQLIFGTSCHAFMSRLHKAAARLRPRGSDGHETHAARLEALRELWRSPLPAEVVKSLGPRNSG